MYKPRRGDSDLAQGEAKRNLGLNKRPFKYIRTPGGMEANYDKGKKGAIRYGFVGAATPPGFDTLLKTVIVYLGFRFATP